MASNEHELKRAAGMDENTDVALGTDKSSILMLGLSVRYPGVLEPVVSEKQLIASASRGYVLGQYYYLGATASQDRLIVVYGNRSGATGFTAYKYVVTASVTASGTLDVTVDAGTVIDNHCVNAVVQPGKRLCICQFGSELISLDTKQFSKTTGNEMLDDIMEIITVFTARYYGLKKYRKTNRKSYKM